VISDFRLRFDGLKVMRGVRATQISRCVSCHRICSLRWLHAYGSHAQALLVRPFTSYSFGFTGEIGTKMLRSRPPPPARWGNRRRAPLRMHSRGFLDNCPSDKMLCLPPSVRSIRHLRARYPNSGFFQEVEKSRTLSPLTPALFLIVLDVTLTSFFDVLKAPRPGHEAVSTLNRGKLRRRSSCRVAHEAGFVHCVLRSHSDGYLAGYDMPPTVPFRIHFLSRSMNSFSPLPIMFTLLIFLNLGCVCVLITSSVAAVDQHGLYSRDRIGLIV